MEMRQFQPIDLALMFSKAHKLTSDRLLELETELNNADHRYHAQLVSALRSDHAAMANAFLELWTEAQQ